MFSNQFILRSRKEKNVKDIINTRFVEEWQTDPPSSDKMYFYEDTFSIPSRLYRESLDRSAPYSVSRHTIDPELEKQRLDILSQISELEKKNLQEELQDAYALYDIILKAQRNSMTESISSNPYFDKYDVAGDSRNIVRELRSVVHEDIVDRGVNESKKLMERMFQR
jgi:hypothetical protein